VVELLLTKCEASSSNPSTTKKKKCLWNGSSGKSVCLSRHSQDPEFQKEKKNLKVVIIINHIKEKKKKKKKAKFSVFFQTLPFLKNLKLLTAPSPIK
jgi:hypothetical protein